MKEFVISPAVNKRLISQLLSTSSTSRENENFALKGSQEFHSRSNDVFGQLKTLEQSHKAWICEHETLNPCEENSCLEKPDSSKRMEITSKSPHFNHNPSNERVVDKKCKELSGVFKKPQSPGINKRKINAAKKFLKYGKKWTKYSLANIPLCSNATNASIALSFINELRKSKTSSKQESVECNQILFSKPKHKMCESSSSSSGLSMKAISPEANTSVEKSKKNPDTIRLSHLENDSD